MKSLLSVLGGSLFAVAALAQPPTVATAVAPAAKNFQFEVASIKPSIPLQEQALSGKMHVGLNIDAARVDIGALSLTDLVQMAFKVKSYQVSGPAWLGGDRFDILAKMPEGATKDDVPQMLQGLLKERFKLTYHHETKEHSAYVLTVAKSGLKMKESPPDEPEPKAGEEKDEPAKADPPKPEKGVQNMSVNGQRMQIKTDGQGGATVLGGKGVGNVKMSVGPNGTMHMEQPKVSMEQLVEVCSRFLDKPVVDETGLKGNYQMVLDLTIDDLRAAAKSAGVAIPGGPGAGDSKSPGDAASTPGGGGILGSIAAMGLKIETRKAPIDVIIIDHIEKAPTEN
jgi:uncharacterized protein (TIGR03435 family)